MMTDNTIDVDAVIRHLAALRVINAIDFMDAVFMRDGKVLEVSHAYRDDFRFTGLSNSYYIETYLGKDEDPQ